MVRKLYKICKYRKIYGVKTIRRFQREKSLRGKPPFCDQILRYLVSSVGAQGDYFEGMYPEGT